MQIHVDADGCPVRDEVYRVAKRYALPVRVVANAWIHTPEDERVELVVVSDGFDAADDWIVGHAEPGDVVVTADIPLAARCLARRAIVLDPRGRSLTEDDIGSALAARALNARLRESGMITGARRPSRRGTARSSSRRSTRRSRRRGAGGRAAREPGQGPGRAGRSRGRRRA